MIGGSPSPPYPPEPGCPGERLAWDWLSTPATHPEIFEIYVLFIEERKTLFIKEHKVRITKQYLTQVIKEEIEKTIKEGFDKTASVDNRKMHTELANKNLYTVVFYTKNGAAQETRNISASNIEELAEEIAKIERGEEDNLQKKLKSYDHDPDDYPGEWETFGAVVSVNGDSDDIVVNKVNAALDAY